MSQVLQHSLFLSVNVRDVLHALVVAVGTAFVQALVPILQNGTLPTLAQLHTALLISLAAGLVYLTKNFFSNTTGNFGPEQNVSQITQSAVLINSTVQPNQPQ